MLNFITSGVQIKSFSLNLGLTVLRVFSGLAIAFGHGISKLPVSSGFIESVGNLGLPAPSFFAWSAAISEFVGGILLALGLATRPSALFLSITMFVAVFLQHADDPFGRKEKALLYLIVFIFFLLSGSGKTSIDAFIRKNK